jgi:hypothetical protein
VKSGLEKLRNLLPFSDAKEGPLSALTLSGERLMGTLGKGVMSGASDLYSAAVKVFAKLPIPSFIDTLISPVLGDIPPLPTVGMQIEGGTAARTMGNRTAGGSNETILIHIGNITLPNVENADSFIKGLQNILIEGGIVL